jgi:hypothetical protein
MDLEIASELFKLCIMTKERHIQEEILGLH